jgi:hypothetical protein
VDWPPRASIEQLLQCTEAIDALLCSRRDITPGGEEGLGATKLEQRTELLAGPWHKCLVQ